VKACTNENKKETSYCCYSVSEIIADCCVQTFAPGYAETWDFGNMDVHGTALILEDGRASTFPATGTGEYVFCRTTGNGILRLKDDR
jgi:hypothetical protein